MRIDANNLASHNSIVHNDEEQRLEALQELALKRMKKVKQTEKSERLHHVRQQDTTTSTD